MITGLFIGGEWVEGEAPAAPVLNKFTGRPLTEVAQASAGQVRRAVSALIAAQEAAPLSPPARARILAGAAELIHQRRATLVPMMIDETGFTEHDVQTEIDRAVSTLRLSGEEATRLTGEMVPLDGAPGVRDRIGFTIRVPVGVVCAITPFNSPLNTPIHKLGPAIAAGNAVILKPATYTPLTAAALVQALLDAGMPPDQIALVHGSADPVGTALLTDPRVGFYTFTGSTAVGQLIQRTVGLRRTQLELGGLSSTVVCADADLDRTADLAVNAAFRKAGQVCTSVQRLFVHKDVRDDFQQRLESRTRAFRAGNPHEADVQCGPLISARDVERVASWISQDVKDGAGLVAGGAVAGNVIEPAIVENPPATGHLMRNEVFGPVVTLNDFTDLDGVLDQVNDTPYGLAAGVFTNDIGRALRAAHRLRMGTVHINQTSSSRIDLMPYGGVKDSGFGQEGPHYAAREMTEERLITISYGSR